MPRPRSNDPAMPFTISLPASLRKRLESAIDTYNALNSSSPILRSYWCADVLKSAVEALEAKNQAKQGHQAQAEAAAAPVPSNAAVIASHTSEAARYGAELGMSPQEVEIREKLASLEARMKRCQAESLPIHPSIQNAYDALLKELKAVEGAPAAPLTAVPSPAPEPARQGPPPTPKGPVEFPPMPSPRKGEQSEPAPRRHPDALKPWEVEEKAPWEE